MTIHVKPSIKPDENHAYGADQGLSRLCGKNRIPPEIIDTISAIEESIIFELRHESLRVHALISRLDYHSRLLHSISKTLTAIKLLIGAGVAAAAIVAAMQATGH